MAAGPPGDAVPPRDRRRRATLAAATAPATGIGLVTGTRGRLVLHPAPSGTGIRFRLGRREVTAGPDTARLAPYCSALALPGGLLLRMPEHLLAALSALGVDDAVAELEGEEVPILDGSALPWCRLILGAGIAETAAPRSRLRLREAVELEWDGRRIRAEPAEEAYLDVSLDLAAWGTIGWAGAPRDGVFVTELAPARSFGRLRWALPAALQARILRRPLLRGASFRNTAPLVGGRILGGARLPAEPVRHRAIDLLGDLALLGAPLEARITAWRPSHAMNHAFLRHLLARAELLETVEG